MKSILLTLTMVFAVLIAADVQSVSAQTATGTASGAFTLQGMLSATDGSAVADGSHTLAATVYQAGTSTVVYTETQTIATAKGLFTTQIGLHGDGGSTLTIQPSMQYDLGLTIDGGAELAPHISLAGSLKAITSDLAANANAVGGFGVSTADNAKANTIVALNGSGKLHGSLIDTGVVRTVNGASGDLRFQGGGDLDVTANGNVVSFSFNGSGGTLAFPFAKSLSLTTGSAFSITNTLAGSAATFSNTGIGAAIEANASAGTALRASSSGSLTGDATIEVSNAGGAAISAEGNASSSAVLKLKNTSADANAGLLTAVNSTGAKVFDVSASGKTTILSTSADALEVTTTSSAGAALKVSGGLTLNGPVGTGQINPGNMSVTVNNPYVTANSIIIVTTAGNGGVGVPLQVAAQGNGSFVVSVMSNAAAVTGIAKFSYLIVNQ